MPRHLSLKADIASLAADVREGLWTRRLWKQMEPLWLRLHAYTAPRSPPMSDQAAALFG